MTICWFDTETKSECDLKSHGTARYAEHPSTDIQLFSYALDDGPVKVWNKEEGDPMPRDLREIFANPEIILWAHNSWFDRNIIENVLGIILPLNRYRCSMAAALSHGLPAGLDKLGEVLGIREDARKIKDGRRLVLLFCKPKKLKDGTFRWATPETHPEDWQQYIEYCRTDTAAMREIVKKIPKWNYPRKDELDLWLLDQTVNSRGMNIDLELANAAMDAIGITQTQLAKSTKKMTSGDVETAGQRDEMLKHILFEYGLELPNMQKATLLRLVENEDTPEPLRELLQVRLSTCTTSTAKYKTLVRATSADGRLRGTIQYAGASRTARDGGRVYQPQNLARAVLPHEEIIEGIDCLKKDCAELLGFDIMKLTSSALRYAICAPKGKKLIVSDLSGIEGRVLAYLAGEEWKVQAYREGQDLYKIAYRKAFDIKPEDVTKEQRQVGKVLELACLGGDTKVLSKRRGWIALSDLQVTDALWDGLAFVYHHGLIQRGVRETINLNGLRSTPDHKFLTQEGWKEASDLDQNTFDSALTKARFKGPPETAPEYPTISNVEEKRLEPVWDIYKCGPRNRFVVLSDKGPVIAKNCGYGGGVGSIVTFATGFGIDLAYLAERVLPSVPDDVLAEADSFYDWMDGMEIKEAQVKAEKEGGAWRDYYEAKRTHKLPKEIHKAIESLKRLWRREHPATVAFWKAAEDALRNAISIGGTDFYFGRCYARRSGNWVRIVLPSGHNLCYPAMRIDKQGKIEFKGVDQFTKKWGAINTAGPKITENIVQAFSRDIFKFGQLEAERRGYSVVLPVHDEIVSEVRDTDAYTLHELEQIMSIVPPWAEGLPLAAEGFEDYRYHK